MPRKPGENIVISNRLYRNKVYNKSRPSRHKFYDTTQWKKLRDWVLRQYPLCQECLKNGIVKNGQVVDHVVSIEDGGSKTDITNLRVLCSACHNRKHFTKKKCKGGRGAKSLGAIKRSADAGLLHTRPK